MRTALDWSTVDDRCLIGWVTVSSRSICHLWILKEKSRRAHNFPTPRNKNDARLTVDFSFITSITIFSPAPTESSFFIKCWCWEKECWWQELDGGPITIFSLLISVARQGFKLLKFWSPAHISFLVFSFFAGDRTYVCLEMEREVVSGSWSFVPFHGPDTTLLSHGWILTYQAYCLSLHQKNKQRRERQAWENPWEIPREVRQHDSMRH